MSWTPPPDYAPAIYHDLFPATVRTPTHTYAKCRIILTAPPNPRVFVFVDSPQGPAAQLITAYDPQQIYGDARKGFDLKVTAPAIFALSIRPEGGCGCGTRLKTLHPFTSMRHSPPPNPAGPLPAPFTTQALQALQPTLV
jgi:hypothetical protein